METLTGNILEQIRKRPSLFLGSRSLSALHHFLVGYGLAYGQLQGRSPDLLPQDFHEWAAYRLHFRESTSGYANMILTRFPDEETALEHFFELLDEHASRRATIVAKVRSHPENLPIRKASGEPISLSSEIEIAVFTNDPGFFALNNDSSSDYPTKITFCPSLSWLRTPYKADAEFVQVFDQQRFDRLLKEQAEFDRVLQEERAERQRKLKDQQPG